MLILGIQQAATGTKLIISFFFLVSATYYLEKWKLEGIFVNLGFLSQLSHEYDSILCTCNHC